MPSKMARPRISRKYYALGLSFLGIVALVRFFGPENSHNHEHLTVDAVRSRPKGSLSRPTERSSSDEIDIDVVKPNQVEDDSKMSEINDWLQKDKCPACLGEYICDDIYGQQVQVSKTVVYETPDVVVYSAKKYVVDSLVEVYAHFVKESSPLAVAFDKYLCMNAGLSLGCDLNKAVPKSHLFQSGALSLDTLTHLTDIVGGNRSDILPTLCVSSNLVTELQGAFTDYEDEQAEERDGRIISTLFLAPDLAVLKFLDLVGNEADKREILGSCGRSYFTGGGMMPLSERLNDDFLDRVRLAERTLGMIEDLLYPVADGRWLMFTVDLTFENLAVNEKDEVVMRDMSHVILVDRSHSQSKLEKACNQDCLQGIAKDLHSHRSADEGCRMLEGHASIMYGIICQFVLSDSSKHKALPGLLPVSLPDQGLLHGIPEEHRADLEEYLEGCIHETGPGQREQDALDLRDYLTSLVATKNVEDQDDEREY